MSKSSAVDTVSGLDYEEIEEAVMETARGRWFLNEFARRNRAAETRLLLDAIKRLEDQLQALSANPTAPAVTAQANAPATGSLRLTAPQQAKPEPTAVPTPVKAPQFVPSDDDLFEPETRAETKPEPASPPARQPAPQARTIGADTLDFSSIEVPPLPDHVEDEDQEDRKDVATAAPAGPEPDSKDENDLTSRDRVIQVTRTGHGARNGRHLADFGAPPATPQLNAQVTAAGQPTAPAAAATSAGSDTGNSQKKRIIVIRRPAEGTEGIPLAGEGGNGDGTGAI